MTPDSLSTVPPVPGSMRVPSAFFCRPVWGSTGERGREGLEAEEESPCEGLLSEGEEEAEEEGFFAEASSLSDLSSLSLSQTEEAACVHCTRLGS